MTNVGWRAAAQRGPLTGPWRRGAKRRDDLELPQPVVSTAWRRARLNKVGVVGRAILLVVVGPLLVALKHAADSNGGQHVVPRAQAETVARAVFYGLSIISTGTSTSKAYYP